jgi:uncharacterized membrane protein
MATAARPDARRRVRLAVAGAVVLTALTTATAAASMPPMEAAGPRARVAAPSVADTGATPGADRVRSSSRPSTRPRTPAPAFLFERGRYTGFDAPGAVQQTGAASVNNLRQIVGNYVDADGAYHGFLRDRRGRFTTIDVPGAKATQIEKINDLGQMVGSYSTTANQIQAPNGKPRGFLLDRGRFIRIDVPGAVQTQAVGLNNLGTVVGEYVDGAGRFHGYRWDRGRYTTVDLPGVDATSLRDLNDRGKLLGVSVADLTAPVPTLRGFVLDKGRVTSFDVPPGPFTLPADINNRDQILATGTSGAVGGGAPVPTIRAFLLAKGAGGPLTPIAFPGAPNTLGGGLNDLGAVVGGYQNPDVAPSAPAGGMQPGGMTTTALTAR